MVERAANLYGTGDGQTVAFLDVFDHGAAAQAYLKIEKAPNMIFAKPLADSPDLSLHGNIVHNIFDSIAPGVSYSYPTSQVSDRAIGIPVFNSAGEAINASVVRGVEFAIEQLPANSIINMSFGIDVTSLDICTKNRLEDLFEEATEKGITLVASAGNSGSNASEYPAASDYVHGIAAVGPDRERTRYSNHDDDVIFAPGGTTELGIIARVPLVNDAGNSYDPRFAEVTGTSFAAPYVSAVVANLLSDGYSVDSISAKLEQITESNCGIVSLNTFYAPECLTEYQEITRTDYGVQRLPHPGHGSTPSSWNTEPYWIGEPPSCGASEQGDTVCYPDSASVARPYLFLQGRRTINGVSYSTAIRALSAYNGAVENDGTAGITLESYGIQIVPYPLNNGSSIDIPFWLDLPDVCDQYGDNFNAQDCTSIAIVPPPAEAESDFYYHGSRPVKPDMIIMDNHYCSGFDGKVFDNASQAACIYRSTLAAMTELATAAADEGTGTPPIVIANPPVELVARNTSLLNAASTPLEAAMVEVLLSTETIADESAAQFSEKIYVPMVIQ